MRPGLRVQLLALLGVLISLAFVPLFFSTSTYTEWSFAQLQREKTQKLALSIAQQIAEAGEQLNEEQLLAVMSLHVGGGAVYAVLTCNSSGEIQLRAGPPEWVQPLSSSTVCAPQAPSFSLTHQKHTLLGARVSNAGGSVVTYARLDAEPEHSRSLATLLGLYMILSALFVLVIAYFALTRWLVRPLLNLDQAAERVAQGSRSFPALSQGPAELLRLQQSLVTMTRKLRDEEDSLRRKIDELETTTLELRQTQASLIRSEKLATVGRLSAGLAHEIGNPISALMGFEDLLLQGELSPEEQRDFLERMKKETQRIHRVLGELLAYARPSPTVLEPESPGHIAEALAQVRALLEPQKSAKSIQWQVDLPEFLPPVRLSHEKLTQVLLNLVLNALDACPDPGQIQVQAHLSSSGRVELRITDNGPGVPEPLQESLFEPFVSSKEVGQGTGLGLSVTRSLVESSGGQIELDTQVASGASFLLSLPQADSTNSLSVTDCS